MKKLLLILLLLPALSGAQIITTIAGTGVPGYNSDSIAATAALLNYPSAVAIDDSGNVYITEENNRVRKVSPGGIITTFAGTGTAGFTGDGFAATAAELSDPNDIAIDNTGNIYVCDYFNARVRKVNHTGGTIITVAGNGFIGYVGDGVQATTTKIWDGGVAVDVSGNIYIAEDTNNRVRVVNTLGIINTFAGNGIGAYWGDGGQATAAEIKGARAVATDALGNVYIADGSQRIRKVAPSGIITTIAGNGTPGSGGDGFAATLAQLNYPSGIAVDNAGNVYISDYRNSCIRMVNTSGIITTIAGNKTPGFSGDGGPATAAEIQTPWGIAVDNEGNVFFADQINQRVRKISSASLLVGTVSSLPDNILLSPNPATTQLTIQSSQPINEVTITNLLGQTVKTSPRPSPKEREVLRIDVSDLPAGVYFVKINGTEVRKFVKE